MALLNPVQNTADALRAVAAVICAASLPVCGAATEYTDRAQFDAAVAALDTLPNRIDFDDLADGTLVPGGSVVGELRLGYSFGGVQVETGTFRNDNGV